MSYKIGKCGICNTAKVELTTHHVVEFLNPKDEIPKIEICRKCHDQQEKYKNYLKDDCGIDIDRKNQSLS